MGRWCRTRPRRGGAEAQRQEGTDHQRRHTSVTNVRKSTLGNWVNASRAEHVGEEPALNLSERARLKELEREVRELRMENEFLGLATAFFAKKSR